MKKYYEVKKCPRCGAYTCERKFTNDVNCFEVYNEVDEFIAIVYPYNITEMEKCKEALKEGECPLCDKWEDGLGYTFMNGLS